LYLPGAGFDQVIRVRDETSQSMFFLDEFKLPLPQVNRMIAKNMKDGIIFRRRQRKLQYFVDEEGHDRTATPRCGSKWATLGIDMSYENSKASYHSGLRYNAPARNPRASYCLA
jgi:hypothetical protein